MALEIGPALNITNCGAKGGQDNVSGRPGTDSTQEGWGGAFKHARKQETNSDVCHQVLVFD